MGPFSFRLFGPSRSERDAEALYGAVLAAARQPALFGSGRAPDTFDGRFEMVVALAAFAFMRLKAAPEASRLAQDFADRLFQGLDESLREAGVGDLSVARHMKGLARRVYGRVQVYGDAIEAGDATTLADALTRNIWNGTLTPFAADMAQWMIGCWREIAAAPLADLLAVQRWPAPPVA